MAKLFSQSRCVATNAQGFRCVRAHAHAMPHVAHVSRKTYEWDDEVQTIVLPDSTPSGLPQLEGPLESWRWWKLGPRGILRSITSDHEWTGPTMTTKINPKTGQPCRVASNNPAVNYGAKYKVEVNQAIDWGVYSYKTPAYLRQHNRGLFAPTDSPLVLGKLHNHGHVVEHTYGYRAQKVTVQEIWAFIKLLTANADPWRRNLERRYQCDAHIVEQSKLDGFVRFFSDTGEVPDE